MQLKPKDFNVEPYESFRSPLQFYKSFAIGRTLLFTKAHSRLESIIPIVNHAAPESLIYRDELLPLNLPDCILKGETDPEGTTHLYDLVDTRLRYLDRLGKLREIMKGGSTHFKLADLVQASTVNSMNRVIQGPMMAIDTASGVTAYVDFSSKFIKLDTCGYSEDFNVCPIQYATDYPMECELADSKRCPYFKNIFYEGDVQ